MIFGNIDVNSISKINAIRLMTDIMSWLFRRIVERY